MRVLIVHQNFPGQFRHVAKAWSQRPGWQVVGIGRETAPGLPELERSGRLTLIRYKPHREVGKEQHHYLRRMEEAYEQDFGWFRAWIAWQRSQRPVIGW